ncbi:MAG: Ldh family oxidoreductase [Bacillota bacterium]
MVLTQCGVTPDNARIAADVLVQADLRGVSSHGVSRLVMYKEKFDQGLIEPHQEVKIINETSSIAVVDGGNVLGLISAVKAMELCMERAETGIYCVALRDSNHTRMLAYYAMMALKKDMIGANPLAVAVPCKQEPPFIFDASTSVVARGKVILAAKRGEKIPVGWGIDKEGNSTDDPVEALAGAILPMAGPKGYGLALTIEILSKILTDSEHNGTLMMAINIDRFLSVDKFKARMDELVQNLKSSPPAANFERVYIPGERSIDTANQRLKQGIPLEGAIIGELDVLADELKIKSLTSRRVSL